MAKEKQAKIPSPVTEKEYKVMSPTGKVHYAWLTHEDKGVRIFDPLCNHRNWIGDYWGKKWGEVDQSTPVTCKNCLSAAGELKPSVKVTVADDRRGHTEEEVIRKFNSPAEARAYIKGIQDAIGWRFASDISTKIT